MSVIKDKNKLSQRLKVLTFALLFLASSIAGSIAMTFPTNAKAAYDMTDQEQASMISYYSAVAYCVYFNMPETITIDPGADTDYSPETIDWFTVNPPTDAYGFPGGRTDCSELMVSALAISGISAEDMLTAMNYEKSGGTNPKWTNVDKSDGMNLANARYSNFRSKLEGSLGPPPTYVGAPERNSLSLKEADGSLPAGLYRMYFSYFGSECGAKDLGEYSTLSDTDKERVDASYTAGKIGYAKIVTPDPSGKPWFKEHGYSYEKNSSGAQTVGVTKGAVEVDAVANKYIAYGYHEGAAVMGGGEQVYTEKTCKQTADLVNQYANGWVFWNVNRAAKEYCKSKGYVNASGTGYSIGTLGACVAGMSHNALVDPVDLAFCRATYASNADSLAACRDGLKQDLSFGLIPELIDAASENATSCVIEGIGWMLCPVLNAIGKVSDAMYRWILQGILLLNPLQMNDANGDPTNEYVAWQRIRDIANVLLVIAFLIVIFSQITSIGVSNYGIKKLLPRVILVAVLVNVSFIVMMFAVDAVNLIGKGLYDILIGLAPDITNATFNEENAIEGFVTGLLSGTAAGAGVFIAGGTIGVIPLALMAVPFIVVAALALFAAIATLFIRNALALILVLVAPIAFAAFLLPNTKSLFDRWRKLLVGVLFLYPTAALLFGGTKFAAYVLANSGGPLNTLIAVFVMTAPLGLLPWLAASSGGILATIGGKLQGLARSAKAPLQKGLQSRIDNHRERYKSGQNTLFGRRRTQSEFDQRQADVTAGRRRRNWGEQLNQARVSRDTDTENAKGTQKANVDERGLRGTSRRDQRMGGINRDSLRLADQKASQSTEYRQQVDRMIATPGTFDAQREARKFDATKASEGYNATTKLRNEQRIVDNVASTAAGVGQNLGDQATETYATNEKIKAAEGKVLTINQNSGAADAAIQQQKVNEQAQGQFSAERQEDFDESIVTDPTLMQVALDTEQAKLGSAVAQGVVSAKVAREKDTGGIMFQEEVKRQALDDKAKRSAEHTQQVIDEARTDKGSRIANLVGTENRDMLQQEKKRREEIKDATTSAQLVQRGEYADRLVNDPAVAVVAGGIDPDGASRVRAGAVAQVRSERNKAIDNHIELYSHEQYDPVTLVDSIANGTLPDGSAATEEQISAAVKYVMTKGTNEQQMQIYDIMAGGDFHNSAPDPADPTKRIISPAPSGRTVPAQVLQDLAAFSSTSKIQSVGGSYQNALNTGSGIPSYNDLIINRVQGTKLTKEKFANMDIDEMTRYAKLAASGAFGSPTDPATQAQRDALKDAITKAKADKNINRYFDKEKTDALDAVLGAI
jgi:hypothetical protein